ncbi:MAG: DNA recombination protein RmuC [Geminicoccaceae bacterium]|nr:DNA recombination protein RmuC [Geminicoccaceae bacterium]
MVPFDGWALAPLFLLLLAFAAGFAAGLAWCGGQRRLAAELLARAERQRQAETEALLDGVKLAFSDIALDQFRKLAEQLGTATRQSLAVERRLDAARLATERAELDARLASVVGQLERLGGLVRELERDREAKLAAVERELQAASERAQELASSTRRLAETLGQARLRGQWGERLAEDILRAAGLVEGVSWRRQQPTGGGRRPDITFFLPDGSRLHLDVKFPFDNWLKAQEAASEAERRRLEAAFLRDVRAAIAEVAGRAYVDPGGGTLEVALLFVPNEPLAASLWSLDPGLVDEALAKRVVLVSPASLFAVLAVLRRAVEAFRLDAARRELAGEAAALRAARAELEAELERLGRRLEEALRAFRTVQAVRQDKLDRHLDRLLPDQRPAGEPLPNDEAAGRGPGSAP